jgi:hypothetical protein
MALSQFLTQGHVAKMTPEQSRLLKIGLHVVRKKGDAPPGTIISVRDSGLQIKWDDGKISDRRHDEMQNIRMTD